MSKPGFSVRKVALVSALGGSIWLLGGCNAAEREEVALDTLPAHVRETMVREAAGGQVTELEREVKNGKTVYSADLSVNGRR